MEMNCDLLKSKLILCEWNAFYFIEIAFIDFTLHEIKQCIVFLGQPVEIVLSFWSSESELRNRSNNNRTNASYTTLCDLTILL